MEKIRKKNGKKWKKNGKKWRKMEKNGEKNESLFNNTVNCLYNFIKNLVITSNDTL